MEHWARASRVAVAPQATSEPRVKGLAIDSGRNLEIRLELSESERNCLSNKVLMLLSGQKEWKRKIWNVTSCNLSNAPRS